MDERESSDAEAPEEQSGRQFGQVFIRDVEEEYRTYANVCGILFTQDDVLFHFGLKDPASPRSADGVAKVYLTIPHAKRLYFAMGALIADYEEMYGEITEEVALQETEGPQETGVDEQTPPKTDTERKV